MDEPLTFPLIDASSLLFSDANNDSTFPPPFMRGLNYSPDSPFFHIGNDLPVDAAPDHDDNASHIAASHAFAFPFEAVAHLSGYVDDNYMNSPNGVSINYDTHNVEQIHDNICIPALNLPSLEPSTPSHIAAIDPTHTTAADAISQASIFTQSHHNPSQNSNNYRANPQFPSNPPFPMTLPLPVLMDRDTDQRRFTHDTYYPHTSNSSSSQPAYRSSTASYIEGDSFSPMHATPHPLQKSNFYVNDIESDSNDASYLQSCTPIDSPLFSPQFVPQTFADSPYSDCDLDLDLDEFWLHQHFNQNIPPQIILNEPKIAVKPIKSTKKRRQRRQSGQSKASIKRERHSDLEAVSNSESAQPPLKKMKMERKQIEKYVAETMSKYAANKVFNELLRGGHVSFDEENGSFTCHKCDKSFGTKCHLKRHCEESHIGRGFKCVYPGCDYDKRGGVFKQRTQAKEHVNNIHFAADCEWSCFLCGDEFTRWWGVRRHLEFKRCKMMKNKGKSKCMFSGEEIAEIVEDAKSGKCKFKCKD